MGSNGSYLPLAPLAERELSPYKVLMLHERGLVDLDADVNAYRPSPPGRSRRTRGRSSLQQNRSERR